MSGQFSIKTRTLTSLFFCLLALAQISTAKVLKIRPSEFKSKIINQNEAFVLFYSPDCPHCHELLHRMKHLAQLRETEPVKAFKMNCKAHPEYITKYDLLYYPSFAYFKNGEMKSIMPAERSSSPSDVASWIDSQTDKLSDRLKSLAKSTNMKSIKSQQKVHLRENKATMLSFTQSVIEYNTLSAKALSGIDEFTI